MTDAAVVSRIANELKPLLSRPAAGHVAQTRSLKLLRDVTQARAVACWRYEDNLELTGFLAVDDMPAVVQTEFIAAIRSVPLTAQQFGVVQAVSCRGPAVNHRAEATENLPPGSIGWLVRLEAESSLAIPVFSGPDLLGAFAVATVLRIEPGDPVWRLMANLAESLERSGIT